MWQLSHNGITIEVPVFLNRADSKFGVYIYKQAIWNTDLSLLKEEAYKVFKEKLSIQWEPFISVYISTTVRPILRTDDWDKKKKERQNARIEFDVQFERYWIGTDDVGNKVYTEWTGDNERPGSRGVHKGLPREYQHGDKHFLIPDTPDTRRTLDEIISRGAAGIKTLTEAILFFK